MCNDNKNNGDNQIRVGQTGGGSTTLAIGNRSITVYDASDERKKDIIGNTSRGLSDVLKWSIKDFTWKPEWDRDSTTIQTGAIAQEIYKVNPELVNKHEIEDENQGRKRAVFAAYRCVAGAAAAHVCAFPGNGTAPPLSTPPALHGLPRHAVPPRSPPLRAARTTQRRTGDQLKSAGALATRAPLL